MTDTKRRRMRAGMTNKQRLAEIAELADDTTPRHVVEERHKREREELRHMTHIRMKKASGRGWRAQEA